MNYKPTEYPHSSNKHQASILDGEMILYSAATENALYLNGSSKLIWELCNGQLTVADIVGLLTEAYPDASAHIESDVNTTLENLLEGRAISFSDTPLETTA